MLIARAHFVTLIFLRETTTAQFRYDFIQNARAINNNNDDDDDDSKSRPKTKDREKKSSVVFSESHPKSTTRRRVDADAVVFSGFYGTKRKIQRKLGAIHVGLRKPSGDDV